MTTKTWVRAGMAIAACMLVACGGDGEESDEELGSCVWAGGEGCDDDVPEDECDGDAGESWATPLTCEERGY